MKLEVNKNKALNEVEISYKEKISNVDTNPLLNPEKGKIIENQEYNELSFKNLIKSINKKSEKDKSNNIEL